MHFPLVSVIIPTYNHAKYIASSVQSILDQTYENLEVIVVNDASTDNTEGVMAQFSDSRIQYIVHSENRYAAAARNTGIRASSGDLIAFMDADDLVHPEKIEHQVAFLNRHPEIGLTYTSRFVIDHLGNFLSLVKAPETVNLSDLVMGYPFAPSEVVLRKEWVWKVDLFDESFIHHGEDPDFFMRLALSGCKMAGGDRFLNFRRLHSGRIFQNFEAKFLDQRRAFNRTFEHPECPKDIRQLRDKSLGNLYLSWSFLAFCQYETNIGQKLLRESLRFDPGILENEAEFFREFLLHNSTRDGGDHAEILTRVFNQLPAEIEGLARYSNQVIGKGYLLRGLWEIIWNRNEESDRLIARAQNYHAQFPDEFKRYLSFQLLSYEEAFGSEGCSITINRIAARVKRLDLLNIRINDVLGEFYVDRSMRFFQMSLYKPVLKNVIRATYYKPSYIRNRGVLSIFFRSLIKSILMIIPNRFDEPDTRSNNEYWHR